MLTLTFEDVDSFDNATNQFITIKGGTYDFEHSLRAIFEWEGKYQRPFLTRDEKTSEEMFNYFKMMCFQKDFEPALFLHNYDNLVKLQEYISSEVSATKINDSGEISTRIITAEVLYAYMFKSGMDISVQDWHISRLLKTLAVISSFSEEPKKMSPDEIRQQNRELNRIRKEKYKTKG